MYRTDSTSDNKKKNLLEESEIRRKYKKRKISVFAKECPSSEKKDTYSIYHGSIKYKEENRKRELFTFLNVEPLIDMNSHEIDNPADLREQKKVHLISFDENMKDINSIFKYIPVMEISNLVGWATHFEHDGCNIEINNVFQHGNISFYKLGIESITNTTKSTMFHLPNAPPHPEFLSFIEHCSAEKIFQVKEQLQSDYAKMINMSFLTFEKKRYYVNNVEYSSFCNDNKDESDEIYQMFKNFCPVKNVEMWRTITRKGNDNLSKLDYIKDLKSKKKGFIDLYNSMYNAFDQSALITIGVAIQEVVTAMLLPLAQEHVERCRNMHCIKDSDMYVDWILPPIEAIGRIVRDNRSVVLHENPENRVYGNRYAHLPSSKPPFLQLFHSNFYQERKHIYSFTKRTQTPKSRIMNGEMKRSQIRKKIENNEIVNGYICLWCFTHGLDYKYVYQNMDLFRLFIASKKNPVPIPLIQSYY